MHTVPVLLLNCTNCTGENMEMGRRVLKGLIKSHTVKEMSLLGTN